MRGNQGGGNNDLEQLYGSQFGNLNLYGNEIELYDVINLIQFLYGLVLKVDEIGRER